MTNRTEGWVPWGNEKDIECAHLLMQLKSVRHDLKMEREYIATLRADADQLRAEHAHERGMAQQEIARLSAVLKGIEEEGTAELNAAVGLRLELAKCREALRQVEWCDNLGAWEQICHWCGGNRPDHKHDCPRQQALGEQE